MNRDDLLWLFGLLEGEGSFLSGPPSRPNCPRVSICMTDEDVVLRVGGLFGRACWATASRRHNHKPTHQVMLTGSKAAALMIEIKPYMGLRRKSQIEKAIAAYDPDLRMKTAVHARKLKPESINKARRHIAKGNSLRSASRLLGVHHESLRRSLR